MQIVILMIFANSTLQCAGPGQTHSWHPAVWSVHIKDSQAWNSRTTGQSQLQEGETCNDQIHSLQKESHSPTKGGKTPGVGWRGVGGISYFKKCTLYYFLNRQLTIGVSKANQQVEAAKQVRNKFNPSWLDNIWRTNRVTFLQQSSPGACTSALWRPGAAQPTWRGPAHWQPQIFTVFKFPLLHVFSV